MISNKMITGRSYKLKFKSPWTDIEISDVVISGITTEDESIKFAKETMYNTFFSAYNIGITDYIKYMNGAVIYICNEIKTKDPIKVDDKTSILIPSTIIDFENVVEYLTSEHVDILIKGVSKHFELVYERGKYIQDFKREISKIVSNLHKIGDIPIEVKLNMTEFIQKKDTQIKLDRLRDEHFELVEKANLANRIKDVEDNRYLRDKLKDLRLTQEDYDRRIDELATLKTSLDTALANVSVNNDYMTSIHNDITTLFSGLEDNTIPIDPTQGTTYANLKSSILGAMPSN